MNIHGNEYVDRSCLRDSPLALGEAGLRLASNGTIATELVEHRWTDAAGGLGTLEVFPLCT